MSHCAIGLLGRPGTWRREHFVLCCQVQLRCCSLLSPLSLTEKTKRSKPSVGETKLCQRARWGPAFLCPVVLCPLLIVRATHAQFHESVFCGCSGFCSLGRICTQKQRWGELCKNSDNSKGMVRPGAFPRSAVS